MSPEDAVGEPPQPPVPPSGPAAPGELCAGEGLRALPAATDRQRRERKRLLERIRSADREVVLEGYGECTRAVAIDRLKSYLAIRDETLCTQEANAVLYDLIQQGMLLFKDGHLERVPMGQM